MSQEDDILSGEEQDDLNASLELDLGTPIKVTKQNYKDLVFLIKGGLPIITPIIILFIANGDIDYGRRPKGHYNYTASTSQDRLVVL